VTSTVLVIGGVVLGSALGFFLASLLATAGMGSLQEENRSLRERIRNLTDRPCGDGE